jgi:hypothetical protein
LSDFDEILSREHIFGVEFENEVRFTKFLHFNPHFETKVDIYDNKTEEEIVQILK